MTSSPKLSEILNVRLDEPLARELRRLAATRDTSESQVARLLLGYGIEVARRLESDRLNRPWEWEKSAPDDPMDITPGTVDITATWRPMTNEELLEAGLDPWVTYDDEESR